MTSVTLRSLFNESMSCLTYGVLACMQYDTRLPQEKMGLLGVNQVQFLSLDVVLPAGL